MATRKGRKGEQLASGFRFDLPEPKAEPPVDEEARRRFIVGETTERAPSTHQRPQKASGAPRQGAGGGKQSSQAPEPASATESGSAYIERAGRGLVRSKLSGEVRRRLTVYMPQDLGQQLDVQAVLEGRNLSDIVADAVTEYMERQRGR